MDFQFLIIAKAAYKSLLLDTLESMAQTELIMAVDQALVALKAARKTLMANAKQEARSKSTTVTAKQAGAQTPARKGMSEEGRLRIAEAQRKRWAVSKRAAKKAARLAAK